jgi:uncharacterized protein YegJ (DUF2314 family)
MRTWWRPPGGEFTWWASFALIAGIVALIWGSVKNSLALMSMGPVFLFAGVSTWLRFPWARVTVVTAFLAFAVLALPIFLAKGVTWKLGIGFALALLTAWQAWRDLRPDSAQRGEKQGEPMVSFALLLSETRYLEAAVLAKIVSKAWGGEYAWSDSVESPPEEGDRWVAGESPYFVVRSPEGVFMVHNHADPYFDEPHKVKESFKDLRLRRAIEINAAWMAVNLMGGTAPDRKPESSYQQIARLIAELAGPDCLAIYQPHTGLMNAWDPGLEEKLRGPDALGEFAKPARPPVVPVDGDAPAMKAAVAEARRRFPEFVEAFQRKDGDHFCVKAPIRGGGNTEFIWVEVDGLEPGLIHGRLANDPVALGGLKLDDRVEVPVEDLNDWLYMKDDRPVGLFTRDAMTGKTS